MAVIAKNITITNSLNQVFVNFTKLQDKMKYSTANGINR